jgi:hypothetical protein
MAGSILLSDIAEKKFTKLAGKQTHLRWCEQLIKRKFPQCAPANRETSCLLEIGDFLGNRSCVAVASFLGVPSALGVLSEMSLFNNVCPLTRGDTFHSFCGSTGYSLSLGYDFSSSVYSECYDITWFSFGVDIPENKSPCAVWVRLIIWVYYLGTVL